MRQAWSKTRCPVKLCTLYFRALLETSIHTDSLLSKDLSEDQHNVFININIPHLRCSLEKKAEPTAAESAYSGQSFASELFCLILMRWDRWLQKHRHAGCAQLPGRTLILFQTYRKIYRQHPHQAIAIFRAYKAKVTVFMNIVHRRIIIEFNVGFTRSYRKEPVSLQKILSSNSSISRVVSGLTRMGYVWAILHPFSVIHSDVWGGVKLLAA
jgi:hypothetical protein